GVHPQTLASPAYRPMILIVHKSENKCWIWSKKFFDFAIEFCSVAQRESLAKYGVHAQGLSPLR
ncbi:MAG: hypothetical protein ACKN82_16530, partial [Pirellula sp.]